MTDQAAEIQTVNVMSDLRNLEMNPNQLIMLLGYYEAYDGGGGYFHWDATNTTNDNGGTVIRSTVGPDVGRWVRRSPEAMTTANGSTHRVEPRLFEYNVRQFGAGSGDITGRTDTCAIQAAIDSVPAIASARIVIPPGTYYISNVHIDKEIILEGVSGGGAGHTDVVLYVVRGHGLIVDSQIGIVDDYTRWLDESALPVCAPCTGTANVNTPGNGAGSIIRNLYISTSPTVTTDETLDGIRVYATCKITDVCIARMGGNGITIGSDFFMPTRGLTCASGWYLERILVVLCKGHGLSVSGGNAGGGLCLQFASSQNGGHGFHDASTVANTYVSARSEDDVNGFHATDPNAPHTFVGCYMEGKGATTFDGGASLIVGGHLGASLEGSRVSHYRSRLTFFDDKLAWPGSLTLETPRGDTSAAFRFAFQQHGLGAHKPGSWYLKRGVDFRQHEVPSGELLPEDAIRWDWLLGGLSRCWTFSYQEPNPSYREAMPQDNRTPFGWTDEFHPRGPGHPFFPKAILNQRAHFSKRMDVEKLEAGNELVASFLWSDWLEPEPGYRTMPSYQDPIYQDPGASLAASFAVEYSDEASLRTGNVRVIGYAIVPPTPGSKKNLCKVRVRNEGTSAATFVLVGHFESFKHWREEDSQLISRV